MSLLDALRGNWIAQEKDLQDRQKFDPLICQCCGHAKKREDDPECVCDGLTWYMLDGGGIECEAHKFARAIGQGKRSFAFWRR